MGWGRNTKDPKLFYEMTTRLSDLDYNVLYLDYDQKEDLEITIRWTCGGAVYQKNVSLCSV